MLSEHLLAFAGGMAVCTGATLGVAAGEHACGRPLRWPRRADGCRRAWAWVQSELRADASTARGYGPLDVARVGVETLLALGLAVRCLLHVLAVFVASPDGDHEAEWDLRLDPITSPRPAWNRVLSRLFTGVMGLWAAQAYGAGYHSTIDPWVLAAVQAYGAANAAVLVGDPGLEVVDWLADRRQEAPNHG